MNLVSLYYEKSEKFIIISFNFKNNLKIILLIQVK